MIEKSRTLPLALKQTLKANSKAKAIFEKLPSSHQREYVNWIASAKKEKTVQRRLTQLVTMLLAKAKPEPSGGNKRSRKQSPSLPAGCLVLFLLLLFSCASLAAEPTNALARIQNVKRIVFIGDSITYAGQYVEAIEAYFVTRHPWRQLEFINLGLSSETVSGLSEEGHAGGRYSRPHLHQRLKPILEKAKPDLVFICYGMNDGIYQPFDEERFRRFQEGMKLAHDQIAAAGAKVMHITPPVFDPVPIPEKVVTNGAGGFSRPYKDYNQVLGRYSSWLLAQRSGSDPSDPPSHYRGPFAGDAENAWKVVDLHGWMSLRLAEERERDTNFLFARDGVHPDANGHWIMAKSVLRYLGAKDLETVSSISEMVSAHPNGKSILPLVREKQQLLRDAWLLEVGHTRPGVKSGLPVPEAEAKAVELNQQIRDLASIRAEPPSFPGTKSQWEGFDRFDFEVNGKPAIVVVPRQALPGKPWIWRGEFFGAFANADAALVAKGFHLAYLRVPDLFGSPAAVRHWNEFYRELTERYGFAKKVALIGLSRGGLYCYNWAIANPDKVACIYADAPVCDFKSWPGRKLAAPAAEDSTAAQWRKLLTAYGFKSDAEALAYRGSPVDNLKPLAEAGVPLLHVYGEADKVVPWRENTGVVAERYRQLGGEIMLIPKPGVDHHPHGLSDPAPIVEFILRHASAGAGE